MPTRIGLGSAFERTWQILQWPVACVLASIGIALVYYFAPDVDQHWTWLAPGTIFATILWLGASLGFRYYVVNVTHYTETYGALGGAMVLLLWFYMSGFVLLLGAVMNAKIEHAAPIGKNPGEKVEGQRRRIGTDSYAPRGSPHAGVVTSRRRQQTTFARPLSSTPGIRPPLPRFVRTSSRTSET